MVGELRPLATDDRLVVRGLDRVHRIRESVGRGQRVEQQRPPEVRIVAWRTVDRAAVVQRERAGRRHGVDRLLRVDFRDVGVREAADPFAVGVVLVEHRVDQVASRDEADRTLLHRAVVDVGADGQVVEINGNTFSASFQSAWGPPIQAFEKLEEMGFTVSAYYYEPGMGFCGMFAEGFDDYFDITDMDSDAVAELLPNVLDEMFNISEDIAMWEEENEDEDETPHEFSTEGKFTVEDGNIDIDINQTGGKW